MPVFKFNTTDSRSALMRKIKSENTKPEIALRKALWSEGIRYRKNVLELPGKPDIFISKHKLVIFIDGEFWHGFNWEEKKKRIKSNREYWIPKIEKNIERDRKTNVLLTAEGYTVLRYWEKSIKNNLNKVMEDILLHCSKK